PQRASARRVAARNATDTTKTAVSPGTPSGGKRRNAAQTAMAADKRVKPEKPLRVRASKNPAAANPPVESKKPAARRKPIAKPAKLAEPPAPKQGYEPEEEVELGATVNPPSGAEVVESVADIVGELASSGLAAGGRLLKDAFSLLRRP
ncbi:MAG: hypothetical protein WA484_11065, partial [Solirubrobacteraceae bacterium]